MKPGPKKGSKHSDRDGYEVGSRRDLCIGFGHKVVVLLEKERERVGIPQSEFCTAIGLPPTSYNRALKHKVGISLYCAVHAYKVLNWDLNDLKKMIWP